MNVCLLNDSFPPLIDGVANTVLNYAEVLSKMEDTFAFVGTPRYPNADYTGYDYPVVAYPSMNIRTLVEGYRAGYPLALKYVSELYQYKPDIIHTHCPVMSTVLARLLREETDVPIVFTYHTKFDEDIAKAVKQKIFQRATASVLVSNISACDEVWTVSEGAGENLRSFGYEGEYRVVLNGVDFPKGRVSEEKVLETVRDFDLPKEVPVFLFVGRIMAYKGLPLIIDALKILSGKGYDFRMVFIGNGVDAPLMKTLALEKGFSVDSVTEEGEIVSQKAGEECKGKVIFTGPIRDRQQLRAWNTRADLFLFPSTYDTNGIVVREAAACGLASVLIKGSCAAEEITDGRNGFLVSEEPEEMAEVLKAVCENPAMARTAGEHAMDEIYMSWEESVGIARGYYEELLEKKRAGLLTKKASNIVLNTAARLDEVGRRILKTSKTVRQRLLKSYEEELIYIDENE